LGIVDGTASDRNKRIVEEALQTRTYVDMDTYLEIHEEGGNGALQIPGESLKEAGKRKYFCLKGNAEN